MLTSVLTAIKSELARVEAFDRDLFVISPEDLTMNIAGAIHLKEVCDPPEQIWCWPPLVYLEPSIFNFSCDCSMRGKRS
jgi:hypothetical protein